MKVPRVADIDGVGEGVLECEADGVLECEADGVLECEADGDPEGVAVNVSDAAATSSITRVAQSTTPVQTKSRITAKQSCVRCMTLD